MNLKKIKDDFEDEHFAGPTFDLEAELNSLLAEELQAAYDYFKVAPFIVGKEGQSCREEFFKHYEEEMEHAKKLIDRLNVLGFTNRVVNIGQVTEWATCPVNPFSVNLEEQCTANRDAESAAIDHYTRVIEALGTSDPVTTDLLKEILADEQEHYSDLQDFINDNQV